MKPDSRKIYKKPTLIKMGNLIDATRGADPDKTNDSGSAKDGGKSKS